MRPALLALLGLLAVATACLAQQIALVDRSHPLLKGCVTWWRAIPGFTGGDRFYDLVGGLPGVLTNMGYSTSTGWSGTQRRGGYAQINFDGTDDYVEVPSSTALDSVVATWMGWFVTSQTVSGVYPFVAGRADASNSSSGIVVFLHTGTALVHAQIKTGGTLAYDLQGGAATNDGQWHHWAVAFDTVLGTLYVDGVAVASSAPAIGWTFNNQVTRLGRALDTFWGLFAGAQDDVRIYSRVLSAGEIAAIVQGARQGDPGLLNVPGLTTVVSAPAGVPSGSFLPFFSR